ncbi:MAG: hypothetical protein PHS34_09400, partial [Candidatus Omnitrophica bacterium]|nr:hypothetical protein [Candidatus Omnitrophota bacterium]
MLTKILPNLIYIDKDNDLQSYYNKQKSQFKLRNNYSIDNKLPTIFNRQTLKNYCLNWNPEKHIQHGFDETKRITVITLIYNCQNFDWLEQSIRSSLWQITDWNLDIQLLFIVDPPLERENEYLLKLNQKYNQYASFNFIFNTERKGY